MFLLTLRLGYHTQMATVLAAAELFVGAGGVQI
jgi:hypothetical protein